MRVSGELDVATTPELANALRASMSRANVVELDLRDLAFMDTSAVHVIVDANDRAEQDQRRLVLLSGRADVDRLLTLTGVVGDLEVVDLSLGARRA